MTNPTAAAALGLLLSLGLSVPAGAAPGAAAPGVRAELSAQLLREPGGRVDGHRIRYPDGRVFVAVDAGTLSLGQCSEGQFCIWTSTGYTGSFTYKTGQDVTRMIDGSVGSFYNNRARAARLYTNTSASSTCYESREKKASVSASYNAAEKVYLSDTTTC